MKLERSSKYSPDEAKVALRRLEERYAVVHAMVGPPRLRLFKSCPNLSVLYSFVYTIRQGISLIFSAQLDVLS